MMTRSGAGMDNAALELARALVTNDPDIEYFVNGSWTTTRPAIPLQGRAAFDDKLGTTHHEAGTLFMGAPGASVTDTSGKFHNVDNAYVAGPAVFPTLGSANPSLTGIALALKTANAIITRRTGAPGPADFEPLSLAASDWRMI